MLSFEGTGKSIEKAIENALLELKAKREDVDIKILDEGGFFKKARVLVSISDDSVEKYKKKVPKFNDEKVENLDVKAMFSDLKKEVEKEKEPSKKDGKTVKEIKDERIEDKQIENKKEKLKNSEIKRQKEESISGKDFIKDILSKLDINANVFVEETAEVINISIEGGNAGDLIGYRGECLNSLQYISSIIENENRQSRKRVILDIEKYRERREESLKGLAQRMERKVFKTNKSIKLEPMNANERRIIHTELQKNDKVTTISKGTEPNRFIIILPKKSDKETVEESYTDNDSSEE